MGKDGGVLRKCCEGFAVSSLHWQHGQIAVTKGGERNEAKERRKKIKEINAVREIYSKYPGI